VLLKECRIRHSVDFGGVAVYSSPLGRAAASAEVLCQAIGIDPATIVLDDRLRETSFGIWEGMTTLEVKTAFPSERRSRKADRWSFAPPGGESIATLAKAMLQFLAALPPTGMPIVVSHCGNIRALYHLLADFERAGALFTDVPHTSVFHWDGTSFHRYDRTG
jgi:probable phosphoglycerate mutase